MARLSHKSGGPTAEFERVSFIDRVTIAQAAPLISHDLGLTKPQMGSVFAAFLIAYAFFEVPSAWYCDRVGARRGLLRIVTAWSFFTALTGLAWNSSIHAFRWIMRTIETTLRL